MARGDEIAFAQFYDAYFERLRRYLLVLAAGNEEAVREALPSTLERVVRHIKPFPSEKIFWGWLSVLARSAFYDQSRKRSRYFSFLDRFKRHTQIQEAAQSDTDARMLALLDEVLVVLPLEDRALVEAKYLDGLSVRQIAERLDTSEKAIESRLTRVRSKLKNLLLERFKHER